MASSPTHSLKLDPELEARLERLATALRSSSDRLMREAIAQFVEREERREQFREDALTAWSEYQATGLHVTAAEADEWLAKLEAGEDVEPPACHE